MQPCGTETAPGATPDAASRSTQWRWALLLVASIHLLTTAGAWQVTDHAEYLFTARRLLDHGTFDLAEPGARRVADLPWIVPGPGETLRSRLLPATPLTLLPLLAADRALGLEDPRQFGRLVHLQGHLFVLAGLFLLGRAVRRGGGSDAAAAGAVALAGLCWPVWMVARRIGPEPILVFLVCLCLAPDRRGWTGLLRGCACCVLPWVSPTGPAIGLALTAAACFDAWRDRGQPNAGGLSGITLAAGGLAAGIAGLLAWNHFYHRHWWLGGYAPYYASLPPFAIERVWQGLGIHLRAMALEGPAILLLAWLGLRRDPAPGSTGVTLACVLTVTLLLMFAPFHQPEPARRLAVVWPCWALVVGRTWDSLRLRGPWAQASLAGGFLAGFYWLVRNDGRYYLAADGLYYPNVLWVKLLLSGASAWLLLPAALLSLLLLAAAAKSWRLVAGPQAGTAA